MSDTDITITRSPTFCFWTPPYDDCPQLMTLDSMLIHGEETFLNVLNEKEYVELFDYCPFSGVKLDYDKIKAAVNDHFKLIPLEEHEIVLGAKAVMVYVDPKPFMQQVQFYTDLSPAEVKHALEQFKLGDNAKQKYFRRPPERLKYV